MREDVGMKLTRRAPKVNADMVGQIRDRVVATGRYAAIPFNPFAHPQWPPFRVCFNGRWIEVEVTEFSEEWGWKAEEVVARNRDLDITPRIDVRGPAPR